MICPLRHEEAQRVIVRTANGIKLGTHSAFQADQVARISFLPAD